MSGPEKEIDEPTGVETTGHEWDGIKELNNPLPRWWLIVFYATIVWAIVYWVFMPAWPGIQGYTEGLRRHSDRENVAADLQGLNAQRAVYAEALRGTSLEEIESNPDLLAFALEAGRSAFGDNCATCHGTGAAGSPGYPNLNDDEWLWGGTLEQIRHTITVGIRSGHEDERFNLMPSFGRDGLLTSEEISALTDYVLALSGEAPATERGQNAEGLFQQHCASCHGPDGRGDQSQGAPDLTDQIWLYGSDRETVYETIFNARAGVMPQWEARLDDLTIDALAVYVHTLGGGE